MLELKPEDFADTTAEPVSVCGRQLIADNSGALYWPSQGTLLVADLRLEGRSAAANGYAAPPPSPTRQTLVRLAEVIDRYEPARVIALGDSVLNGAAACLTARDLEILGILQEDREWIWLTGQHEAGIAPQLGGCVRAELELSGIALKYRPAPRWVTHEISAFMRPAARVSLYGYSIRRACFVGNGRRLVMPAFGASTGRNVLDDAFRPLFGSGGMAVWMLGQGGLYPVATRFLAGD